MSNAPQQTVIVQSPPSNGLGTAGFVVSLIGFITCGLISPLGLLFSVLGLMKPPRGLAIAGTVLGAIGSAWLLAGGLAIILAVLGANEAEKIKQRMKDEQKTVEPADATK